MHRPPPKPAEANPRPTPHPTFRTPTAIALAVLCAPILAFTPTPSRAQPFELTLATPSLDRWMYPHNATPGSRPTAPVFGTLGDDSGVDSRHGQFLIGFDLSSLVTTNLGPASYLFHRCRLSLTVTRDRSFILDPTPDPPASYLREGHPDRAADTDAGRPLELFGVGYRNGFTAESFTEDAPFGNAAMGQRNAFAAGYDTHGTLVDVGNNVGKTNATFQPFHAAPFAVGTSSTVAPGDPVPSGTVIDFDLNLDDPLVVQYLQQACHTGRLRLMLTSLQTSGFGAQPAWAEFHTRNSVLGDPPRLALAGTAVQQTDSDGDGLPDDWERHVSGSLAHGPADDTDGDGLPASAEWEAGTDPHNPAEVLRASLLPAHSIGNPRLRFRYAPSRHYTLGVSTNLHTWESLPRGPIAHEPGSPWATLELPSISPATTVFFRVHATPAPTTPP